MDETGARIETNEVVKSFEAFLDEHVAQQKMLQDQMMASVRNMCYLPVNGTKKVKQTSNRVALGTINNLLLFMSAHQRLVSSLVCDIAEGRIGKANRKAKLQKNNLLPLSKKRKASLPLVGDDDFGLKQDDEKNGGETYFYTPKELLNTLENK